MAEQNWKFKCRFFNSYGPCKFYYVDKSLCERCNHYSPFEQRILLIKLDALGDVLRTTPLATALKKRYPDAQLTWLTRESSFQLIKNNPNIDRILIYDFETVDRLQNEKFSILINLDKDEKIAALTSLIKADKKMGYGLNEEGHTYPISKGAEYHYDISLDDWGKNRDNEKSYQEMIFEAAELPYENEGYVLNLGQEELDFAKEFSKKLNKKLVTIGLNTGCGPRWPHKKWVTENFIELIERLGDNYNIILLGGKDETETNRKIREKVRTKVMESGDNELNKFAAIVNLCDILVAGDTLHMHIGIALKKKVIALFGPTPHSQINLYGRGKKLIGKVPCLVCYEEFPCIQEKENKPNCMETITVEEVHKTIKELE